MSSMSSKEIDQVVLEALREIAKDGDERRVGGKQVRLAAPKDGDCVYMRIALDVDRRGIMSLAESVLDYYGQLERSLLRLKNRDLVFNNGSDSVDDRSFWVVMG